MAQQTPEDKRPRPEQEPTVAASSGDGLETAASAPKVTGAGAPGELLAPGDSIGQYRVLRMLGEGGFGVVYLAQQVVPIRREVAVKLIRAGVAHGSILARFEAERQTLARMSHPGIATVIDAGATERGDSFFVMEYVNGQPIDVVCNDKQLSVSARINLLCQVCEAMQHAHGKGIIHRDLKPGNILVQQDGETLHARVIDFGIAKAVDADALDSGVVTMEGQFLGTPCYMAPEQTGFMGQDVDVRADVYSLASVLFELLVGQPPVASDTIRAQREEGGFSALQELLCVTPVQRASLVLARLNRTDPTDAAARAAACGTDVRGLARALHGDIDWILMRALDRDRERRYATPMELAADLERHLAHLPVLASPPSIAYRSSKFIRRHRTLVSAVLGVFLVLVAALVYSNIARQRAQQALLETSDTLRFVEDSFGLVDPSQGGGQDLSAVEFFQAGFETLRSSESIEPRVRARLFSMYASVFTSLGEFAQAEESARLGLALFVDRSMTSDDEVSADSLRSQLMQALLNQGHQSAALAVQSDFESGSADAHAARAYLLHNAGDMVEAARHYGQEQELRELVGDSYDLAQNLEFHGRLLVDMGDLERGRSMIEASAAMRQRLQENGPTAADGGSLLARGYMEAACGNWSQALQHIEDAHALYRQLHGTDDAFMVELCRLEAAAMVEDARALDLELATELAAPMGGFETGFIEAIMLRNRARVLHRIGALAPAWDRLQRALDNDQLDESFHAHTLMVAAQMRLDEGDPELAMSVLQRALAILGHDQSVPGRAAAEALMQRALQQAGIPLDS